jgi:hypothetical protein
MRGMLNLCGLMKGRFAYGPLSFLYAKLWRNAREKGCMNEK